MRFKKKSFFVIAVFFVGLVFSSFAEAKTEFFMKEKANLPGLTCKTCHESVPTKGDADKKLNDTGAYYREHKSLPPKK